MDLKIATTKSDSERMADCRPQTDKRNAEYVAHTPYKEFIDFTPA